MNEECVENIELISGVIEYEILEDKVNLVIKKQLREEFEICKEANSKCYILGACNHIEYDSGGMYVRLYLKGNNDFGEINPNILIKREDWEVYAPMLEEKGFKLIDKYSLAEEETESSECLDGTSFENNLEEPTDEELDKMIELVDLNTFMGIIRTRMKGDGNSGEEISKINRAWAKRYLKQWAIAKYRFYKMLGDKLKIEKDIEIELDNSYFETMQRELMGKFPLFYPMLSQISSRAFRENMIRDGRCWCEAFSDRRVVEGMTLTKFISLFGSNELNIEVSKIYQNKNKAHLTISIDPNDYLTVSINHSGWRSCHNFFDGEWRNAGLSYMVDNTSLVAYRSNGEVDYRFEGTNFKWNSKNWRQMIYMAENNSTIIFSRQYPNESNELARNIRGTFEEVVSNYFDAENTWKVYNNVDQANVEVSNVELLYNDINNGFGHKVVKNKFDKDLNNPTHIQLGRYPKRVGDMRSFIESDCEDIW